MSNKNKVYLIICSAFFVVGAITAGLFIKSKIQNKAIEPKIQAQLILNPTYETVDGKFNAGTAFVLKLDDHKEKIILTALHVFGPAGGLRSQIKSEELPKFIKNASFIDEFDDSPIKIITKPLGLVGAKVGGINANRDAAAFEVRGESALPFMTLCSKKPEIGDTVWLVSSLISGAPRLQKLHEATVVFSDNDVLKFKYKASNIKLTATSGSPIINSDGQVVGLNVGGIEGSDPLIGVANPATNLKELLENTLNHSEADRLSK
jgi:hypothetical protein